MLESLQGIEGSLHNIIEYMVKELSVAETPDYKCMLVQGLSMCLWYNTAQTLQSLEQLGCTQNLFALIFNLVETNTVKQDFEIKRLVLGLSSVIQRDPTEIPQSVQALLQNVMKVLVYLCQRSIIVRSKNNEKAEQCEEDPIEAGAVYEDECDNELALISDDEDDEDDEDYDCNEDIDRDLYDSKLDQMDEVLFCRDVIMSMEQN